MRSLRIAIKMLKLSAPTLQYGKNLEIPEFRIEKFPENTVIECDPIDRIFYEYSKHPSILKIKNTTNSLETFSSNKINEMHAMKDIRSLNTKKSAGYNSIPPKIVKGPVSVLTIPLKDLFNGSVEKCLFPSDLKYADVIPLFIKDDNTKKENSSKRNTSSFLCPCLPCRVNSNHENVFVILPLQQVKNSCLGLYRWIHRIHRSLQYH